VESGDKESTARAEPTTGPKDLEAVHGDRHCPSAMDMGIAMRDRDAGRQRTARIVVFTV